MINKEIGFIDNKIYFERLSNDDPNNDKIILFVNGLYDSIENSSLDNKDLNDELIKNSKVIYNFDYSCGDFKKGKSKGDIKKSNLFVMINDIESVARYIFETEQVPIEIISHSSGCILSKEIADKYPTMISKLIWIAPAINDIPAVLKYMFKRSINFSKIDFTEIEKKKFINSFVYDIDHFNFYSGFLKIISPENETESRKKWNNKFILDNNFSLREYPNVDHLFHDKNGSHPNGWAKNLVNFITND